jgi:flagellar L-ring protein precursor FlgH
MKAFYLIVFASLVFLTGCAAQREEKISASLQEDYDKVVSVHEKPVDGAIFSAAQPGFFVGDRRAHSVGDVLTVNLAEETQASKSNDGAISRKGSTSTTLPGSIFGATGMLGLTNPSVSTSGNWSSTTDQSYAGKGTADQSNKLSGTLTVMVTRVYENGNMWVEGQKMLTLNQGEEYIRVSGLVRPEDIKAGNQVDSGRIAQAQISYTGAGDLADASKQNWFGRFFGWAAPI